MSIKKVICMLGLLAVVFATPVQAVILYSKSERNTAAPTGKLANSGWQWEGKWNGFLGTAIGKSFFVTAEHIGGQVGEYFTYNGKKYKTVATFDDPNSDLQVWRIHGQFSSFAPLLTDYSDINKPAMIFGRGTQRGADVGVGNELKGWLWGDNDGVQSWGMNVINGSSQGMTDGTSAGRKKVKGGRLYWSFDREGIDNEGALSEGDSGGGVFIFSDKKWRLAGVNYSTQATFSYPNTTDLLSGALFDAGGLGSGDGIITDTAADIPALSFATRISTQSKWISEVVAGRVSPSKNSPMTGDGVPEPAIGCLAFVLLLGMNRRGLRR